MKTQKNRLFKIIEKRLTDFQATGDTCIWMKAGIVNFRLCDSAYDYNDCSFDRGMRKTMNVNAPFQDQTDSPSWVEYLRKRFRGSDRPCRHTLTERVDAPKKCIMNYECYHCAYDQMLDEEDEQITAMGLILEKLSFDPIALAN